MTIRKGIGILLLLALAGILGTPAAQAAVETGDEALARAESLWKELLPKAEKAAPVERWNRLVREKGTAEEQAINALALVSDLFPGADPSRWDEVQGFWYPAAVPQALAALDAVFYGARALLTMDDSRAPWLARWMVEALMASARARSLALTTPPAGIGEILEALSAKAPPPVEIWSLGTPVGKLPFARPVSGAVGEIRVFTDDLVPLDKFGVPTAGTAYYAWDRRKGKIYLVRLDEKG